tara:strand:+ start:1760 stop:1960 length:201 start_codon:yes stop_codon:yes gene_type:complete
MKTLELTKKLYCISEDQNSKLEKYQIYTPLFYMKDDTDPSDIQEFVELDGMEGVMFNTEHFVTVRV